MKHICPECGNNEFYTTAHVVQEWKVDEDGNFLSCSEDCLEVLSGPDNENCWFCTKCGSEAVMK